MNNDNIQPTLSNGYIVLISANLNWTMHINKNKMNHIKTVNAAHTAINADAVTIKFLIY